MSIRAPPVTSLRPTSGARPTLWETPLYSPVQPYLKPSYGSNCPRAQASQLNDRHRDAQFHKCRQFILDEGIKKQDNIHRCTETGRVALMCRPSRGYPSMACWVQPPKETHNHNKWDGPQPKIKPSKVNQWFHMDQNKIKNTILNPWV